MTRGGVSVLLALAAALAPLAATAQTSAAGTGHVLRADWSVERSAAGRPRVVGYLYNESPTMDAANVLLRVDRLGPDGRVERTHRSRVMGDVLQGGRLAFEVPVDAPAATYRVVVESVDWLRECR